MRCSRGFCSAVRIARTWPAVEPPDTPDIMLDWFLNPWSMLAGVLLIASPIIIHLINRIRYKRIQWAAMEFLLKAQKRMRRKMILQQLLLLLARILAVLLLGLLVGRFLGFGKSGEDARATHHIVILDDTPSMGDTWQGDDGVPTTAFEQAKKVLFEQILKNAALATTPQTVEVVRLSELDQPITVAGPGNYTSEKARIQDKSFAPVKARVSLKSGLKKAQASFAEMPGDLAKVLHVLSDFRAPDWTEDADGIKEISTELASAKIPLNLVDVAHPYRKTTDKAAPLAHDNLAITELTPAKLIVARYEPIEFTLRIKNYGAAEMKSLRFAVKVNGDENKGRSVSVETLPGFQERTLKFELTFDRLGSQDAPLDRFSLISVTLETPEPGGLVVDNIRHTVVEVRERLPILVIEGRPNLRESKDGDGFYLRPVFTAVLGGFSWVNGTLLELEKADLSKYAFVLLLNVPSLPDAAAKNVENYAKNGGGVGFFLGPDVRAAEYNKALYREGQGFFPVPLAEQPSVELTEEQIQAQRFRISQKKLLVREASRRNHPALAGLYTDERGEPVKDAEQLERVFGFISIKRYWPVPRLGRWREDRSVTELYCMPNEQSLGDYEAAIRKISDTLPVDDAELAKFKPLLTKFREDLRRLSISTEPLYRLAGTLDDLLADQRGFGDPSEALLREFWGLPKMADLRREATRLRDTVKFGDPFYVVKDFGKGRVSVITTTAGETWTDWPSEKPGSASYSPIMKEMASYLSGAGSNENRTLGRAVEFNLETERYKGQVQRSFLTHIPTPGTTSGTAPRVDIKEQTMSTEAGQWKFVFNEAKEAGAYLMTFTNIKPAAMGATEGVEVPEYRAFALNVDANHEGDLRRATSDDIILTAVGGKLHSVNDADWAKGLRNKKSDLSESIWLVVLLGLLLLAEQYLSMRMSFNSAGEHHESPPVRPRNVLANAA
ncbi:MAG: BatA domain-containing protein [Fimbriiglobus sp.]